MLLKSKSTSLLVVLVLLIFYALNDAWNSGNTGVSDDNRTNVYVLLISLIVSMCTYIFVYKKYHIVKPGYVIMMYILTAWIVFENFAVDIGGWVRFVHIFLAIWWLVTYSYFNLLLQNRPNLLPDIRKFFFILMCLYIGLTIYSYMNIMSVMTMKGVNYMAVLNYSYFVLAFVPFTFLFKKKIRNISLIAIIALLIFSMKRGPLIIFPLMYLTYIYADSIIKGKKSGFITKLLFFIIVFGIAFYIGDEMSGGFLSQRFDKEELRDGSNRSFIYELALSSISSRDFVTLLTGTGSGSSVQFIGTGVHNEWLEFLFTFGIIGVFLYFLFGIAVLKRYRRFLKNKSPYAPILGTLTVFFWTVGMFSGFYFTHSSFYFFACLGVIEALECNRIRSLAFDGKSIQR